MYHDREPLHREEEEEEEEEAEGKEAIDLTFVVCKIYTTGSFEYTPGEVSGHPAVDQSKRPPSMH